MTRYELIQNMSKEELAKFLYVHISRKGLKKTEEWLDEEVEEE